MCSENILFYYLKAVKLVLLSDRAGPGRGLFLLALTLALRVGPPPAWPWPRVSLTPGQEGLVRADSGPLIFSSKLNFFYQIQ